ncbi:keratin, type I cytoskeletal 20 [Enhydra lutris kenyoni]|uniref:Keratin, type I cytoskeletal 20 n=1 Tax=Enhydra lutris kenyoni TaxID=391180 RepID=A0A2Y9JY03_ENHLU|nr:keratin, type I cytoskeletal 20 [Enhydra lutris kenyoni]
MEFTRRSLHRGLSSSSQGPAISVSGSTHRKGGMQHLAAAPSVYGGAGGQGIRISNSRYMMSYGGDPSGGDLFVGNGKMTMQNLNERLANYLAKVQSLEKSNSELELQIKQWYETNTPNTKDHSAYYQQIEELQNQIKKAQLENAHCVLQIDNARMAAEDFKLKYENERALHLTVEGEIQGLNKVLGDLSLTRTDLEIQLKELSKNLDILKKEHQEEVDSLRKHLGNTVSVELDAAPGLNLGTTMNEMRQKYEVIAQDKLQKAKEQFEKQTQALQQHVTLSNEELKETEAHIKELRRTYQNLEIELQSLLSLKETLEHTLEDTKDHYSRKLATIQGVMDNLEAQLVQIRKDTECQSNEYNILLDIKTRLEQEIATYRRLLEGDVIKTTEDDLSISEEKDIKRKRKIMTVVQEMVDGKVVSYKTNEVEEDL